MTGGLNSLFTLKSRDSESFRMSNKSATLVRIKAGDPVTDFALDEQRGGIATSFVSGKVLFTPIGKSGDVISMQKLLETLCAASKRPEDSTILCLLSEEGIRGISCIDQVIYAVVGDIRVKVWPSLDEQPDLISVDRQHQYTQCLSTFTIVSGRHCLILMGGSCEVVYLDLVSRQQKTVPLNVPSGTIPLFFNEKWLLWSVPDMRSRSISMFSVCVPLSPSDPLSLQLAAQWTFPDSKASYWGFKVSNSGKYMVVVSKVNKISVWTRHGKQYSFSTKCKRVVGFDIKEKDEKLFIATISDDQSFKLWCNGKLEETIHRIRGDFSLLYPYVVKWVYPSHLIYSSDEGVHVVNVPAF